MTKTIPCAAPGCLSNATERRDRSLNEATTGAVVQVMWRLCATHAAECDADPDAFLRRMAAFSMKHSRNA